MKKILVTLILFSQLALSYDVNSISKLKPVWQDFAFTLNHQVSLMAGFGRVDAYLCLVRNTDYQNHSNLKDSNGTSIGYIAKLDEASCGQVPITLPWVVKSEQTSTDSPLNIEMINYQCPLGDLSNCETMINSKMTLTEEDSASNPYGILTFDYFYGTRPDSSPLYLATYDSKKVDNKIQFESAIFVDSKLINPATYPNTGMASEFYSAKIIHTPGVGGEGSVKTLVHRNDGAYEAVGPGYQSYPDGNPTFIRTTSFVYDDGHILYRDIDKDGIAVDDRCIDKKKANGWNYVPSWFGYGVYKENGDRYDGGIIEVSYSGPIATSGETFTGTVQIISATNIGIPLVCKKVKDGTHYNANDICSHSNFAGSPITIAGEVYENFPMFDIPDKTVLSDGTNEYYVRQLRPRIVYSEAPLSECASMTIGTTKETADHTFFNYPELSLPKRGAVLVNKLSSDPTRDIAFNGKKWVASNDDDGDLVLNSLDMFPDDPLKSGDADLDGIDDSQDGTNSEFKFNWNKYSGKTMFSAYEKNKLN